LARWYNGGKSLNLDEMACGLVRTFIADSAIADSAPAGTAYAAGVKSHTGYIGVLPDEATMPGLAPIPAEDRKKPVANVLEAARLQGKSTGIVATSEIMHATPAAFTAHYPDRKNYDDLSEQQVYQGVDLVLGGGAKYFTSEVRGDKEDLIGEIKNLGYEYITTPDELKNFDGGKLWGMFADTDMAYEFDRDPAKEPSLSEMTAQAIQLLSKNENGFFLMVEGSKIDWAAHANDPIGVICDTLAFDEAVGVALEFAKADGNTAVISVADHATGGLSIGSPNTDANYDKVHIDNYIVPLKKAALTGEGVEKKLNSDKSNIVEVMSQYYGVSDLTGAEIDGIKAAQAGSLNYTVGPIISKRANLGWTTIGHTGEDVPLYVYAPEGHKISGVIDSTQIAKYIAEVLGLDLDAVSEKLFISARKGFEAKGAAVSWDASDEKNPVITAEKDGTVIKIPVNKNVAYINGEKTLLDGVVVYNGETTYVPQSAIDLLEE
jgi:alkaline phosphatase